MINVFLCSKYSNFFYSIPYSEKTNEIRGEIFCARILFNQSTNCVNTLRLLLCQIGKCYLLSDVFSFFILLMFLTICHSTTDAWSLFCLQTVPELACCLLCWSALKAGKILSLEGGEEEKVTQVSMFPTLQDFIFSSVILQKTGKRSGIKFGLCNALK